MNQTASMNQCSYVITLNLEMAVVSTHLAQPIDSPSVSEESLITNKVTAISPDTPDKSIDHTMHALPTAVSRLKGFSDLTDRTN
jgi:hypothetical protein